MTIKRLILPVILLAGLAMPAKALDPAIAALGITGAVKDLRVSPIGAALCAVCATLVTRNVKMDPNAAELIKRVGVAAVVQSAVHWLTSNETIKTHVRSLPVVGGYLSEALCEQGCIPANVAAFVSTQLPIPYAN